MSKMKASDHLALFLQDKKIKVVFGIIGSGNAHIFDAIARLGYTQIVCVHHEQAAAMAMTSYYRITGNISATLLTTGAGSSNGVTGVLSAWMDSLPGIIISGNENSKFTTKENPLRIWGVQGYDSTETVKTMTKYTARVMQGKNILYELEKAYHITLDSRPGPVWVDVPMNVQAEMVATDELIHFTAEKKENKLEKIQNFSRDLLQLLKEAKRPVLWLGNGLRLAGGEHLAQRLVEELNIPTLVTWSAMDMLDSYHPLNFGRAGVYGQRAANFVVQNADLVISLGTRMALPQIGYQIDELARMAKIVAIDIDQAELEKYASRLNSSLCADAREFSEVLLEMNQTKNDFSEWIQKCNWYKNEFPLLEEAIHPDEDNFINSYRFMDKLNHHLKADQIITTDMGTALLSGHQMLRLRQGMRLFTSLGLGEMGFGLPGAIGAAFASLEKGGSGEVLCLNCDGGMMMNLQELQTVAHHKLPIKIIIFNNDGYLMIKHTQKALMEGRATAVDKNSGVTCPDYQKVANTFGFLALKIHTWNDFESEIPKMQNHNGPVICEVFMHPKQLMVPKLGLVSKGNGVIVSPPLEDLSPLISREKLTQAMLIGLHPKSKD